MLPVQKMGPNKPCLCGSGVKFKKCCGPRNGMTELQHAEHEAYREKHDREYVRDPKALEKIQAMLGLASMANVGMTRPPRPRPPRRKRSRGGRGW